MIVPKVCSDPQDAAAAVAKIFVEAAPARVALAGGSTPLLTYQLLSRSAHPWDRTDIFLTDERCVPLDNPQSNHRMVSEMLGTTGARIHPVDTSLPPEQAASQYAQELRDFLPLDLVLLGVGTDGHTASLFQGADLDPAGDVAAAWSKESGLWRVTLTSRPLAGSRQLVYLVIGPEKAPVVERMLRGDAIPAVRIAEGRDVILVCDQAAIGSAVA